MSLAHSNPVNDARARPTQWFIVIIIAAILFASFIDLGNYFSAIDPSYQPKRVYLLLVGLSLGVLLLAQRFPGGGMRTSFVALLFVYVFLNLVHAYFFDWRAGSNGQDIAMFRAQVPPIALVFGLAVIIVPRHLLARIFVLILLVVSASVIVDFLKPQWLYPMDAPAAVPGRAAGFLVNPTKAGEVIMLSFLLALPALTPRRGLLLYLFAGLAIFLTFSRGAMFIWILVFAFLWMIGSLPRGSIIVVGLSLAGLTASLGLITLYISQGSTAANIPELIQRLGFFSGDQITDDSATTRMQLFVEGLRLFASQPVFGMGAGASDEWRFEVGPHNQAVLMSADYGVLGLLMWVSIGLLCLTGRYYQDFRLQWLSTGVFVAFSMLTHNMLDFTYWMLALLLLSSSLGVPHPSRTVSMIRS